MTTPPILRKPKLHFDTEENPSHVTFDDGKDRRRNIPWLHYVEANWDYDEPDVIRLKIGEWIIVLRGNNLAPLYLAIEKRTLVRVRAQPDMAEDREREMDTFVTSLRFTEPPAGGIGAKGRKQIELNLGG
jgi:hypothetical protein